MELFSVTIALLAGFPLNLMAVTAASFLFPLPNLTAPLCYTSKNNVEQSDGLF